MRHAMEKRNDRLPLSPKRKKRQTDYGHVNLKPSTIFHPFQGFHPIAVVLIPVRQFAMKTLTGQVA
jgi:hypothetical protein